MMKDKIKSFGFWTALAGAAVVLVNALGSAFGFHVEEELVRDIIMAVAGVLVVLGVVTMPKGDKQDKPTDQTEQTDDKKEKDSD